MVASLGWYKAWGACGECDYVGDLWFNDDAEGVEKREGLCPVCGCLTSLDAMPEYPSAV